MQTDFTLTFNDPDAQTKEYLGQCMRLACSLVIKSQARLRQMNEPILALGQNLPLNKADWPYHRMVAGFTQDSPGYHEQVIVSSYDRYEQIVFTPEQLELNPQTKEVYRIGSTEMTLLLDKFPLHESYIKSARYPADLATAVSAQDHTILAYDTDLIEPHETSMLHDLQQFIYSFSSAYYNDGFCIQPQYLMAFSVVRIQAVFLKILNLRLARSRSSEAHSYHISKFLSSHHHLDQFMPYLKRAQQLFLMRNMRVLNRRAGRQSNFNWLVEELLTPRGIPVSEVNIHLKDTFNDQHLPELLVRFKPLNPVYNNVVEYVDFEYLTDLEARLSAPNEEFYLHNTQSEADRFSRSVSSTVKTKDLVSAVVDYSNLTPYTFPEVVLNHWLAWGYSTDVYFDRTTAQWVHVNLPLADPQIKITFTDPRTLKLHDTTVLGAFVYLLIISEAFYSGQAPEFVPSAYAEKTVVYNRPELSDLIAGRVMTPAALKAAELLLDAFEEPSECNNTLDLYNEAIKVHGFYKYALKLQGAAANAQDRADIERMASKFFTGLYTEFVDEDFNPLKVEEFLQASNLPLSLEMTAKEYEDLFKSVAYATLRYREEDDKNIVRIQKALIEIMRRLCSYTVQFITTSTDDPSLLLEIIDPRFGDIDAQANGQINLHYMALDPQITQVQAQTQSSLDLTLNHQKLVTSALVLSQPKLDLPPISIKGTSFTTTTTGFMSGFVGITLYDARDPEIADHNQVFYLEHFYSLPEEVLSQIKSVGPFQN